jgi:hypothetical protein
MMTSQVLRALETKELIHRAAHPVDARARALTVTPQGAALADAANAAVEDADRTFFASLANERPAPAPRSQQPLTRGTADESPSHRRIRLRHDRRRPDQHLTLAGGGPPPELRSFAKIPG